MFSHPFSKKVSFSRAMSSRVSSYPPITCDSPAFEKKKLKHSTTFDNFYTKGTICCAPKSTRIQTHTRWLPKNRRIECLTGRLDKSQIDLQSSTNEHQNTHSTELQNLTSRIRYCLRIHRLYHKKSDYYPLTRATICSK
jgi:hypothetical protein